MNTVYILFFAGSNFVNRGSLNEPEESGKLPSKVFLMIGLM